MSISRLFKGHAERVLDADLNKPAEDSFYLAHHAVYKESASTPLRVVFDGSMKTTSGVSLNDQLLVGPTVYPPLNDVLIRFRKHPYVLTTDVSKMYRAPLELRVLHSWQQTRYCDLQRKMNQSSPSLQKAVKESFYVDDGLPFVETKQEAISLHHQLQDLFK